MALEIPTTLFGELSEAQFLSEYWQRKPLLVRNAWPNFITPVLPSRLKKIACRDDADSRLVLERGGEYPWEVRFGPFEGDDFDHLPETHWTLLVQYADRLDSEVARMLEAVKFLPTWRLDDIMISYAPGEGGVGPHIDNYDVFLLQAHGRRRWQIQAQPIADENLVPDIDVRMLSDFRADQEWILEPGDMLYLPPRIAHYGVALGHCMTFSIGCRAPSKQEILTGYLEDYITDAGAEIFFSDAGRTASDTPGRIDQQIKMFAREAIDEFRSDTTRLERWLGRMLTRGNTAPDDAMADLEDVDTGRSEADQPEDGSARLLHEINTGGRIVPVTPAQIAYDRLSAGTLVLYVNGEDMEVITDLEPFLEKLTRVHGFCADALPPAGTALHDAAIELTQKLVDLDVLRLVS